MYCNVLQRGVLLYIYIYIYITKPSVYFTNGVPLHGTVQYGSLWGGSLGAVPGTFLVPPQPRLQAKRTITKTRRVNSAAH